MPSDIPPPLARSPHEQLIVYAIRITDQDIESNPEFEGLPDIGATLCLAYSISSFWPTARHGIVTIRGKGDYRIDECAVVLADNSTREAMNVPNPEQLARIQETLRTDRKPRWYRLTC
ncbi:hypothetical protein D9758_017633 [Tetrapyrgos nigripes]|uniref:Uncharacterized protein n=1 Tax=Tetrapyrgos nigripes TaxID=182062 RepID=A0A8H5CGF0_9AGAR|nr:hypothetical protein D9758_017633 [Tetrapyrgos nigripes]